MSRGAVSMRSGARGRRGRLRGLLAMVVGGALLCAGLLGGGERAGADSAIVSYGWWYLPNQVPNNAAAPPAPPWVPSDGMYVAGAEAGPLAIAAVKLVSDGRVTLNLDLTANGQAGLPSVAACLALTTWDGASAGRWEGRPAYDCANEAIGEVSEDGATMSFALDPGKHQENGFYNVALVPTGLVPFSATFNAPGAKSLVVTGGTSAASAPDEPDADFGAGGSAEFGSGSDFSADAFSGSAGSFSISEVPAPAPQASGPVIQPASPLVPAGVDEALKLPDDRNQRIAAVAGLGLLVLGAWLFGGRTVRPPRLLGSTAARSASATAMAGGAGSDAPVRGIGRFARPRS